MLRGVAGVQPSRAAQLLFVGRGLDFQSTADQPLARVFQGTQFRIMDVVVVRKTGSAGVACLGGIYDAAAKGGNAIVAATQSYITLGAGVIVAPLLAGLVGQQVLTASLFLSLSTGSATACTADVFVFGFPID